MGVKLKIILLTKYILWCIGVLLLVLFNLNLFPSGVRQIYNIITNYNFIVACVGMVPIVSVLCVFGIRKKTNRKEKLPYIVMILLEIFGIISHLFSFVLLTGGV